MSALTRSRVALGIVMLALVAVLFAIAPTASFGAPSATTNTVKWIDNGDFVSLDLWDGPCYGEITVSRGGSAQSPQTTLLYEVWRWDPATQECGDEVAGYGQIPNDSFRVLGKTRTLDVDTGKLPDLELWSGPKGTFALTWKQLSDYVSSYRSTSVYRLPGFTQHYNGSGSSYQAVVNGSFLGRTVSAAPGSIGKQKSVETSVCHQTTGCD